MRSSRDTIIERRDVHQRRLDELHLKLAQLGISAPPEVKTEIDDIQLEIHKLNASLGAIETVGDLYRQTDTYYHDRRDAEPRIHAMVATIQSTVAEFASLKLFVKDEFAKVYRVLGIGVLVLIGFMIAIMFIVVFKG